MISIQKHIMNGLAYCKHSWDFIYIFNISLSLILPMVQ